MKDVTVFPGLTKVKTPISYYGGKQSMLKHILPLIPEHKIYVEPFFGGGAVFWSKPPVKCEVINDVNGNITNFYEVLKHDFFNLREKIEVTLHSRETYKQALVIYKLPHLFDRTIRAWAFWVVTNQGFSCKIGNWGYDREKRAHTIANKVEAFKEELADRLRNAQVECNEASKVIMSRDSDDTFVYADPPYIDSNQGHYGGYTHEHFRRDLDALVSMKGKFLLSTYPSEVLNEYIDKYGLYTRAIDKPLSVGNGSKIKKRKRKTEVLTSNYPII
ncbi:DNA adenine methylase [Aquimarina algiphila]|nr:DNA adenine methylase [Aquimarina algiphila]